MATFSEIGFHLFSTLFFFIYYFHLRWETNIAKREEETGGKDFEHFFGVKKTLTLFHK